MSGRPVDAATAVQWGLINAAVEDGGAIAAAQAMARVIAGNAPLGVTESLRLADRAFDLAEDKLWQENQEAMYRIGTSKDSREGARAFVEKRAPVWQGE